MVRDKRCAHGGLRPILSAAGMPVTAGIPALCAPTTAPGQVEYGPRTPRLCGPELFFHDIIHAIKTSPADKICAWGDRLYTAIEKVMLTEFLVDTLMLLAVLHRRVRIRAGRILLAGAAGGLLSGVAALIMPNGAMRLFTAIVTAPWLIVIATGRLSLRALPGACGALISASALTAAMAQLFPETGLLTAALIGAAAAWLTLGGSRRWAESWDAGAVIEAPWGEAAIKGIIDTGNRLREPLSGLPVMVVSANALDGLPEGFDPLSPAEALPGEFRLTAYGGLGGNGCLGCFMPDRLRIEFGGQVFPAYGIWAAIYPGTLPGGHGALIPPEALGGYNDRTKRRKI